MVKLVHIFMWKMYVLSESLYYSCAIKSSGIAITLTCTLLMIHLNFFIKKIQCHHLFWFSSMTMWWNHWTFSFDCKAFKSKSRQNFNDIRWGKIKLMNSMISHLCSVVWVERKKTVDSTLLYITTIWQSITYYYYKRMERTINQVYVL